MVNNSRSIFAFFLVVLLLSACGGTAPPAATGTGGQALAAATPTFIPTLGVDDFQNLAATTQALNAAAQSTLQASIAQETSVAAAATAQVAAVQTATQSAVFAAASATAAVETATAQALSVQQTQVALSITSTAGAMHTALTATTAAQMVNHEAAVQAQLREQNEQAISAAATQSAIDNDIRMSQAQRERNWANFTLVAPYLFTAVIIGILAAAIVYLIYKEKNRVQVINGNVLMIEGGRDQSPFIYDLGQRALPAPTATLPHNEIEGEYEDAPEPIVEPASWEKFCNWSDPLNLPIGITMNRRRPVLINRDMSPHLLIFGKSGIGKTTSGLIPYTLAMARAGVHVIIFNPQGANFQPFDGMPGVTVTPSLTDDEAPAALTPLLDIAVQEITRRDKVLARYGVDSWYQLPPYAGQPGEFLIAVDEFLNIVATVRKSPLYKGKGLDDHFWLQLIRLTSRARKYGIFIALTMTEPRQSMLGDDGMAVRGQMSRVGFHMDNAAASHSILDRPRDYPKGSTGLPAGQFLAAINGQVTRTIAFYPQKDQIRDFLMNHVPRPTPLPEQLSDVVKPALPGGWTEDAVALSEAFLADQPSLMPDEDKTIMRYLNHEKAAAILRDAQQAPSFREIERSHWPFEGGVATETVRGVLAAKFIQLYHYQKMPPDQITSQLMPRFNEKAVRGVVREALTEYEKLAEAL